MTDYYNIYVCEAKVFGQAVAQIGKNVPEHRLERMLISGLYRIDRDHYFVSEAIVGDSNDLRMTAEVQQVAMKAAYA